MRKVRIAVFGLNHGYKFAVDAKGLPDVDLVATAGFGDLAERRAKELGSPLYSDFNELVEKCDIDGAIIALPNKLHLPAAKVCAERGVGVLVEKPIASTIGDANRIVDLCKKHKVGLLIGQAHRFSGKLRKLRELVTSGTLGEIIGVHMFCVAAKDRDYFNEKWRVSPGGGPLLINGIHDIDALRFITGKEFSSVYAAARNFIRGNPVEDSASVVLETAGGLTATFFISDGAPSPWFYEFNTKEYILYEKYDENCYYVFGTKGSVSFPDLVLRYYEDDKYGWNYRLQTIKHEVPEVDPLTEELKHFIEVLRGTEEPYVTGEDGTETLRLMQAISKSAETGEKVNVEEIS